MGETGQGCSPKSGKREDTPGYVGHGGGGGQFQAYRSTITEMSQI